MATFKTIAKHVAATSFFLALISFFGIEDWAENFAENEGKIAGVIAWLVISGIATMKTWAPEIREYLNEKDED